MLNPAHLASLIAIDEHGGFAAAGEAIGRSHSAISLHVKALEAQLGTTLVDRSVRPTALTGDGAALVARSRQLRDLMQEMEAIGRTARLVGTVSVGLVPTAMTYLVPPALSRIRGAHPELTLEIRTGLSGELAQAVRAGELDVALVSAPQSAQEDLLALPIAREPLVLIAPGSLEELDDSALLTRHPFIWFNRKTWAGQHIDRLLARDGIAVRSMIEVDSIEAIEALVAEGLGVAIVPDRCPGRLREGLVRRPFGGVAGYRDLVLLTRRRSPKSRMTDELAQALEASASTLGIGLSSTRAGS